MMPLKATNATDVATANREAGDRRWTLRKEPARDGCRSVCHTESAGECPEDQHKSKRVIGQECVINRRTLYGPEVGLGEAQCQRMPTQPRVPRSPFVDNFRLADDSEVDADKLVFQY
jgi:hypothetical protein